MPKPKKERQPSKVIISKQQRKGNKYVTIISGLAANGIEIDSAKKFLAQKFACSCSKGDGDELIIQGDVLDNLFDVIPEQYSEVRQFLIQLFQLLFNYSILDNRGYDRREKLKSLILFYWFFFNLIKILSHFLILLFKLH